MKGFARTLDLTFGYLIEDHFVTTLSWRDRNLLGRAWHLETRGISASYRTPLGATRRFKLPRLLGPNTGFKP